MCILFYNFTNIQIGFGMSQSRNVQDRVAVKWSDGQEYAALVIKVNSPYHTVIFAADGSTGENLTIAKHGLAVVPTAKHQALGVGCHLLVLDRNGRPHRATILEMNVDGTFDVRYVEDSVVEADLSVGVGKVRRCIQTTPTVYDLWAPGNYHSGYATMTAPDTARAYNGAVAAELLDLVMLTSYYGNGSANTKVPLKVQIV